MLTFKLLVEGTKEPIFFDDIANETFIHLALDIKEVLEIHNETHAMSVDEKIPHHHSTFGDINSHQKAIYIRGAVKDDKSNITAFASIIIAMNVPYRLEVQTFLTS